ncbi:MAG: DNA polymerase III subunit beta [Actinobacteria bacterium]|nr:DNA polymerase III subunit beta [Actinomycetota bacterium]MCB9411537.1 DNA polymerase III subunit beta [Actinomycetota bacterium]
MKLRVERDALADAVSWTARTLPKMSGTLSGILLDATGEILDLSSYDLDVSSEASLPSVVEEPGRVLVSGKLLADIARALPAAPVTIASDAGRVVLTCGRTRFTLPLLPETDYPPLPELPPEAGKTTGAAFAQAVGQTFVATSKIDTMAMFMGIRMEIVGEDLTLAATDRYRLAVRELTWSPAAVGFEREVIVPGKSLFDVAKSLSGSEFVHLALAADERSDRSLGVVGDDRKFTTRLLDGQFPKFRDLLPRDFSSSVRANVAELSDAIKRVALVAERHMPVRLNISEGEIELRVGASEETQAVESVEASLEGSPMTIAFNPTFLLDGLHALDEPVVVIRYNEAAKPSVISGAADFEAEPATDYRYLLMPVKI